MTWVQMNSSRAPHRSCLSEMCIRDRYMSKQNASDIGDRDTPVAKLLTQHIKLSLIHIS